MSRHERDQVSIKERAIIRWIIEPVIEEETVTAEEVSRSGHIQSKATKYVAE